MKTCNGHELSEKPVIINITMTIFLENKELLMSCGLIIPLFYLSRCEAVNCTLHFAQLLW
jgi:hypothetical protein